MPEGDTIFRAARTLNAALAGKEIVGFQSRVASLARARLSGSRVERVEARGKNLLIHFEDGRVLYSHMRMVGSWHLYRPGERWQKPERLARAVLSTEDRVAVCFNAPILEILPAGGVDRHPTLSRLGPDLLSEDFSAAEALRRLRARGRLPAGEALLLQSAVAGIGNVYKSETLFLCGISPFRTVAELSDAELESLIARGRELLARNLGTSHRRTRPSADGQRYWVYGRSGRPCRRCGTAIRMRRQGLAGRSTYWCSGCQTEGER